MNYSNWIQQMMDVKRQMRVLDSGGLYHYYQPNRCCSVEDIIQAENHLGISLDEQYADFLQYANGWREFYRSISLLGTNELTASPQIDMAREILEIVCPLDDSLEFKEKDLIPIAVDEYGADLFVLTPPLKEKHSMVIWFAGQEIERFQSFEEFLNTVLQYVVDEMEQYKK